MQTEKWIAVGKINEEKKNTNGTERSIFVFSSFQSLTVLLFHRHTERQGISKSKDLLLLPSQNAAAKESFE